MHTMWKGSISFGLVNVPVRMFAATESKDVKFRYLHKECKTPIQYTRTCPTCNRPVEYNEIVRGFEYEPDRFVIFDEEELQAVNKPRAHTIDIVDFVQLSEIDPVYYDKSYYLSPESTGTKAYRLLQQAMQETGKIAIAKTVLRNAETLAAIRVYQDVLVMESIFWPDEVRPVQELPNLTANPLVTEQELKMAVTLIDQLASPFEPGKYTDERRDALTKAIQQKVANEDVSIPTPAGTQPENIVDLMQALQESIKRTKAESKPEKKTRKRSS